jgi:hypothetical protein
LLSNDGNNFFVKVYNDGYKWMARLDVRIDRHSQVKDAGSIGKSWFGGAVLGQKFAGEEWGMHAG